jgi:hypothetical protein
MSHFAKVENGIVTDIIVAEQDFIDSGVVGDPSLWIQTSYNTMGGVHYQPDSNFTIPSVDQSKALRANYANFGYTYDSEKDVFYAPQPFPSWTLNQTSFLWEPPVPYPNPDENVFKGWNESTLSWEKEPT